MTTWKTFALRTLLATMVGSFGVFVAVRAAQGDPGGATSHNLTFSGVLRSADGALPTASRTAMLTFAFTKAGGATCTPAPVSATIAGGGGFSVLVPLSSCPAFFDGADVTYTVSEGATMLTTAPVAVTPVPYARYADQVGVSDCPVGYERDTSATGIILCTRTLTLGTTTLRDELVRVGVGRTAFWVDRYEASVHSAATGTQLGASNATGGGADDIDSSGLTRSGQRLAGDGPARALSHPGQPTVNITWFQANEACRASGKRMMHRDEWFAASSGTIDSGTCQTATTNIGVRAAAPSNRCVSSAGAHDMIGNVWEWTEEWFAGNGATAPVNIALTNWPAEYNGDATWNVNGAVNRGDGNQTGMPSAALRGGYWFGGSQAGIFAFALGDGPSNRTPSIGFRCVLPN